MIADDKCQAYGFIASMDVMSLWWKPGKKGIKPPQWFRIPLPVQEIAVVATITITRWEN